MRHTPIMADNADKHGWLGWYVHVNMLNIITIIE